MIIVISASPLQLTPLSLSLSLPVKSSLPPFPTRNIAVLPHQGQVYLLDSLRSARLGHDGARGEGGRSSSSLRQNEYRSFYRCRCCCCRPSRCWRWQQHWQWAATRSGGCRVLRALRYALLPNDALVRGMRREPHVAGLAARHSEVADTAAAEVSALPQRCGSQDRGVRHALPHASTRLCG